MNERRLLGILGLELFDPAQQALLYCTGRLAVVIGVLLEILELTTEFLLFRFLSHVIVIEREASLKEDDERL